MFFFSQNQKQSRTDTIGEEIQALKKQLAEEQSKQTALQEELESKQGIIQTLEESLNEKTDAFHSNQEQMKNLEKDFVYLQQHTEHALGLTSQLNEIDLNAEQENTDAKMDKLLESTSTAVSSIQTLNSDLSNVSEFISLIKEISDQTGLLAMNASIEAARAGEEGRGFSIVADEVNKLSEKTQKAVMDIKVIIDSIHKSMEEAEQNIIHTATELDHFNEDAPNDLQQQQLHSLLVKEIEQISEQINTISDRHL